MRARISILALSLPVCAWFAIAARQSHELARAGAIINQASPPGAAQARHVSSLLRSAGTLNPDLQVDLLRAQLALEEGMPAQARRIVWRVVRQEPDNLDGWILYARASAHNPPTFYVAELAIGRLLRMFRPAR